MNLFDTIRTMLGLTEGADVPETGAPAATPSVQEPLTSVTVGALRAMLDEHDRGYFLRSGLLADLLRRDADIYGALLQRQLKLQSKPVRFLAADESDAAKASAADLGAAWPGILSVGARSDLEIDTYMLGFGLGQLVWTWDDARGHLWPHEEPWPAYASEFNRVERQWYAYTLNRGRIPITPGDGQWVLHAPRSARAPWLWGAIRPAAEWSLRTSYSAADASRLAEVHGSTVWKASLPAGARETPDGKGFLRSIRGMGRNAVIPVPKGRTPEESYDVEIVQAATDTYRIFEFLMRVAGGRIRIAILGQDLTTQNNTVGTNASSSTGESVLDDVTEADARAESDTFTRQIAAPLARYTGAPPVRVVVDAEPEEDLAREATSMGAIADAGAKWKAAGIDVDFEALADRARVPRKTRASL